MPKRPPRPARPTAPPTPTPAEPSGLLGDAEPGAAALGEWLRRAALGLVGGLVVARAYWFGEGLDEHDSGSGLAWTLGLLAASALAALAAWLEGGLKLRRSWADAAALALFALVGLSARGANERRVAINRAWEWVGVGLIYILIRTLPKSRGESSALAGALVATAVAVAAYGLYQVGVEHPADRARYNQNKVESLIAVGVDPHDPRAVRRFEDRLLGSLEPTACFALANTLAGVLVGPAAVGLAVAWRGAKRPRGPERGRFGPLALASGPLLILLTCLLLTKSRSAYLGLIVALLVWGHRQRGRVSGRGIALAALGGIALAAVMVAAAAWAGQLDLQVLTESSKSLRYRLEYWRGAWGILTDGPKTWWAGLGPGNFAGPYLRHKLPWASEEISDPHNLFLEVWTTAGLAALAALVAALGLGLRDLFGPSRPVAAEAPDPIAAAPPRSGGWLLAASGLGGWALVVALGRINPIAEDRWVVLGVAWGVAALLGGPLWRGRPIAGDALGLGVVAVLVNLLAAGGIGFAPVAVMLWGGLALGLNLRDDRPCGVPRRWGGRWLAFLPMAAVAALLGTFLGTVVPFWNADALIVQADALIRPPRLDPDRADALYKQANQTDALGARGWIGRANATYLMWVRDAAPPDLLSWKRIDSALTQAATLPRNRASLAAQTLRTAMARDFLRRPNLPGEVRRAIQSDRLDAAERCVLLSPGNALFRVELAAALADVHQYRRAAGEASRALKLDRQTPHADKKLPPETREQIAADLQAWTLW